MTRDADQWRAVVNAVMNLWVPKDVGKFLSSCVTGGFSRRAQLHEVSQDGLKLQSTVHVMKEPWSHGEAGCVRLLPVPFFP
jgi:hypothetical protein